MVIVLGLVGTLQGADTQRPFVRYEEDLEEIPIQQ